MLTAIIAVTLSVPDLGTAEQAYARWLNYRTVDQGQVSRDLAAAWGAPLAEGRRYALMQPESGEPTYLRLVQSPPTPGYEVMKTHGWNSNEILVEDPDKLAKMLEGSPFRMIGEPRPLSTNPEIRAMQVIGPAGELNYFTRIPAGGASVIRSSAKSFVDRTFIVVLGGASMPAMQAFYRDTLGQTVTAPVDAAIGVLQKAWGWKADVTTPLALATISSGFVIELDEYPKEATPRPVREGDLPPGIAIVSFAVKALDERPLAFTVPPGPRSAAPYAGRRSAMIRGAAGEWLELIEAP